MYWDHKEMDLVSNHTRIDMPVYIQVLERRSVRWTPLQKFHCCMQKLHYQQGEIMYLKL